MEALQAILDYVQTPQTDYALLINGPWGCGKTYFWRNVVEPKLAQVKGIGKSWRPLYASLYGCRSTKDIDTQLFLASHPKLRKRWMSKLAAVGGNVFNQGLKLFTQFELPAIDLRWLLRTDQGVLCFDDLERAGLPMREALGYINTFVEHEGVKTIILCNEGAITRKKDKKTYAAMKEKVVGISLTFQPDLDLVFKTLIAEHGARNAFHEFLLKHVELLRELFERSETHNVRSLRRALATLAFVFDALQTDGVDPTAVGKQLVYAVAPAAFELHGRGADPVKLRKILGTEHMAVIGAARGAARRAGKSVEKEYEEEFAERYFQELTLSDWRDAVGCPPVCEFLLTGVLDRPALVAWARALLEPPDERKERISQLCSHGGMEDEEFVRTAEQVLSEVEGGEIGAIGSYMNLYSWFEHYADAGLIAMGRKAVLGKFMEGLNKALGAGKLEPYMHLNGTIDLSNPPRTDEARTLRQRVLEANAEALEQQDRERVGRVLSRLEEDAGDFLHALAVDGEGGLLSVPVFQELDADDFVQRVLRFSNYHRSRLDMALQVRYERHVHGPEFAVELPCLTEIRDQLRAYFEAEAPKQKPLPMSLYLLQGIVSSLDNAVQRLERVLQQSGASEATEGKPQEGDRGAESSEDLA